MTEPNPPPSLEELGRRLREARSGKDAPDGPQGSGGQALAGMGFAFRIGTELVAALMVGLGIGLLLDHWLHTGPWFLVVFFFLGSAAGVLNVYRTLSGNGPFQKAGQNDDDAKDKPDRGDNSGREG